MNNSPGRLWQFLYHPDTPPTPCPPGTHYTLPKEMHPCFSSSHLSSSPPPPPIKYLASVVGEAHITNPWLSLTFSSVSLVRYMSMFFSTVVTHRGNREMEGGNEHLKHLGFIQAPLPEWHCQTGWNLSLEESYNDGLLLSSVKSVQIDAFWIRMLRYQTPLV